MLRAIIIGLALIALSVSFFYFTGSSNSAPEEFPSILMRDITDPANAGDRLLPAPDFTLTDMQGRDFTLSEHKGKVVVLNIWATWCPPCRDEIPDFMELQEEMESDGVLFLGVSIDKEGWEVVRPFVNDLQINYPQVIDDGTVVELYGPIIGVPMTFLINREGYVEGYAPGMLHKERLKPILEALTRS